MSGWVEQQILEAQKEGAFDNLPGSGKPLEGLDGHRDEMWWIKEKLKREQLDLSPPTIVMRRKVEIWLEAFESFETEAKVQREAIDLNAQISRANGTELGPLMPQVLLDVDALCRRWRAANVS
jgi:hypothetical protein